MSDLFSDEDRRRIREAIARAEGRTAGEIVPFVVPRSDDYEVATWRGAGAGLLLASAVAMAVFQLYDGWGLAWLHTGWGTALLMIGAALAGGLTTRFVPVVRRLMAGDDEMADRVHDRAVEAFVDEELFDTSDRTGILLFVSLLEHRIEVLGDTGINAEVDPDDWVEVIARLRRGVRNDRLTDGLVDAIELCGELLARRGVEVQPDDENELSDSVRLGSSSGEDEPG